MLAARGLSCRRGDRTVFAGLDIALGPGEALVVTGANGSGKTSLLRILAGLMRPASGSVERGGACQLVGHSDAVKAALTVAENLAHHVRLAGGGSVAEGLSAVGLARLADVPVRVLSAGQRRRLALARLFAVAAPIWLVDEPATALDSDAVGRFEAGIGRHLSGGGVAVVSTNVPLGLAGARSDGMSDYMS